MAASSRHGTVITSIDLAQFKVVLADAVKSSKDNGSTLDLSDKRIGELPIEILEVMQANVTRYDFISLYSSSDWLWDIIY